MRVISQLFCMVLFIGPCIDSNLILKEKGSPKRVEINYVDPFILTFSRVECDDFYDYFEETSYVSFDGEIANQFVEMISSLEEIDSKFDKKVDTRAKIKIVTDKGVKSICFGLTSLEIDNTCYQTSDSLINFMSKLNKGK